MPVGAKVVSLAAGGFHTCAAFDNGDAYCWGRASEGQLGDGSFATPKQLAPVKVAGLTKKVVELTAGDLFTCARLEDATVVCWGGNDQGMLGNGTKTSSASPVGVTGVTNAVQLVSGEEFACARLATGAVTCWGANASGQLGDATNIGASAPVAVMMLTTATGLAAGNGHACAQLATGGVRCWGANAKGQLGNQSLVSSNVPVTPFGLD